MITMPVTRSERTSHPVRFRRSPGQRASSPFLVPVMDHADMHARVAPLIGSGDHHDGVEGNLVAERQLQLPSSHLFASLSATLLRFSPLDHGNESADDGLHFL